MTTAKLTALAVAALITLITTHPAHAVECYVLKSADGRTLFNKSRPPFDLSYPPFSPEYQAARARGEHLIIIPDSECFDEVAFEQRINLVRGIVYERNLQAEAARASGGGASGNAVSGFNAFRSDPYSAYSADPNFRPKTKFLTIDNAPKPRQRDADSSRTVGDPAYWQGWGQNAQAYPGSTQAQSPSSSGYGGYNPPSSSSPPSSYNSGYNPATQPPPATYTQPPTNAPGYSGYIPPSAPVTVGRFTSSPPR